MLVLSNVSSTDVLYMNRDLDLLLNISYKDNVTNEEARNRIQNAIGVHNDLQTMVKKRKLIWYDHISRSSGMATTFLQGTVK